MILALRTDKPEAELYLYQDGQQIDALTWQAHRALSDTLLTQIETLLSRNQTTTKALSGVAVFEGPGSFTGLRIGISVANSLAYSLNIPVVATRGEDWQKTAQAELARQTTYQAAVLPHYGSEANITQPRK